MSTLILENSRASAQSIGWIISKRDDLVWFIGGSLISYLVLLGLFSGMPLVPVLITWTLLIDGPHVFATVTRTYFDKTTRAKLGWHLWVIIPFLIVCPVLWGLGLSSILMVAFVAWTQFHVAKQHFGFVMLYKRKTNERGDISLDKAFLLTSLMTPWALFAVGKSNAIGPTIGRTILISALIACLAMTCFYVRHQIQKAARGDELNRPKLFLLACIIPLQWVISLSLFDKPNGVLIAGMLTNIGHSLQYQRLTWFHNRNRYQGETTKSVGLAAIVNKRYVTFFLATVVLNLSLPIAFRHFVTSPALLASLLAISMTHYYLDSKIWRVRGDKDLAKALRLT